MSAEETLEAMKSYLAGFGITYDGEKYTDKDGKELTNEEVTAIIEAATAEAGEAEEKDAE